MSTDKNMLPTKKNKHSKTVLTLISLSTCAVVALSLAPTLLSTSYGKKCLCKFINSRTHGTLQIESLSLSWFGSQHIEGINFSDSKQSYYASCQMITSNSSLFSILGQNNFGDMNIVSPHLKIKKDISRQQKIKPEAMMKGSLMFIPIAPGYLKNMIFTMSGRILVKEGIIDVLTVALDPICICDIQSTVFISKDSFNLSIFLKASTSQGPQKGTMAISSALKNIDSLDAEVTLNTSLSNLPTRGLDQVLTFFRPECKNTLGAMVGDTLNLDLSGQVSRSKANLNFDIKSDRVQAKLSTVSDGSVVTIDQPATISFTSDADTIRSLWDTLPRSLQGPVRATASLSQFELPIESSGLNFNDLKLSCALDIAPVTIVTHEKSPIIAGPFSMTLTSQAVETGSKFNISCPVSVGKDKGMAKVEGNSKMFFLPHKQVNMNIDLSHIPSKVFALLFDKEILSAALGPDMSASIRMSRFKEVLNIKASLDSSNLQMKEANLVYKEGLILKSPVSLSLQMTEQIIHRLHPKEHITIPAPFPINVEVRSFSLPALSQPELMSIDATLSSPKATFLRGGTLPIQLVDVDLHLQTNTFTDLRCDLTSKNLSLSLEGAIDFNTRIFTPKKSTKISLTLDDGIPLQDFISKTGMTLSQPAKLSFEFYGDKIPFNIDMPYATDIKVRLSSEPLHLQSIRGERKAEIEDLEGTITYDHITRAIDSKMTSKLISDGSTSSIGLSLIIDSIFTGNTISFDHINVKGDMTIKKLPLKLINLGKVRSKLAHIIGESIDINTKFALSEKIKSAQLALSSPNLTVKGGLVLQDGVLRLPSSQIEARLKVTPESYVEIEKILTMRASLPPFNLSESTTFTIKVDQLHVPMTTGRCPSVSGALCSIMSGKDAKVSALIQNDALSFTDKTKQRSVTMKNSKISIDKQPGSAPLQVAVSADTTSSRSKGAEHAGNISMQASLLDLYDDSGVFDPNKVSSSISATINKVPSSVFDFFASTFGSTTESFSAIFGPSITATASLRLQNATGPVSININTFNTRASLSGVMTQGALTLKEPIYAQVTMTPALSKFLLSEVNPLSITEIRSTSPITLEIQPQGFVAPILDFSLKKVNIPKGRLELGQISCKNEGNLTLALSLLKSVQLTQNHNLNLWFTPIDFSVRQGIVDVERTDILVAETFDIALWGQIYPLKDNVDMVLGLTADCLARAFNIKNLPDDYVLQVPMTGSLHDVKLNTGKATAKVAALLALQQADLAGGPAGALFGKFINKLGSLPLNDRSTPPAKRPFPWEKSTPPQQEPPQEANKKAIKPKKAHFKRGEKPLKQMLKILK